MLPTLITDAAEILEHQNRLQSELMKMGRDFEARYQTRGVPDGMRLPACYFVNHDIYWKSGDSSSVIGTGIALASEDRAI